MPKEGRVAHSSCQLNEKEMKASVFKTESHSEEALGRS